MRGNEENACAHSSLGQVHVSETRLGDRDAAFFVLIFHGSSNPVDVPVDRRTLSAFEIQENNDKGTAEKGAFACCLDAAMHTEVFQDVVANLFPV